jgi:hypothetical protein
MEQGVRAINLLGYKNSTWVRARMRDVRLLDIRTTLATNILTMRDVDLGHRIQALAQIESALVCHTTKLLLLSLE